MKIYLTVHENLPWLEYGRLSPEQMFPRRSQTLRDFSVGGGHVFVWTPAGESIGPQAAISHCYYRLDVPNLTSSPGFVTESETISS